MDAIIVPIFLIVIGGASTYMGVKLFRFRMKLSRWKRVEGRVLNKFVGERKILPGTDLDNYRVYLEYEYKVGEELITGNNLYAAELLGGETSTLGRMAKKKLEEIPEHVTVKYNPENPKESFLYQMGILYPLVCVVVGVPAVIGGIVILFV